MKKLVLLVGPFATIVSVWALIALFFLSIVWVKIFLVGSLVTSGVKAVSDNCGTEYGIERAPIVKISGNWFCPSKK